MIDKFRWIVEKLIRENYPQDCDERIESLDYSKSLLQLGYDSIDASMLAIDLENEFDVLLSDHEDMGKTLDEICEICETKL